ncbi:MAG TPA: RiPP maturation radical SAM C-methyltransferase, partial [Thermoanaerobaculia bacterium]|nr:RiPP maturation radical SAM C-methyltransferase [Thermoanaerobaculia bacterium]
MNIALVVMPFAAAERPSLGVGLLQSLLRRRGFGCDAKYFNLTFASLIGLEDYKRFAEEFPIGALAGEWVFSQAFYGRELSDWDSYAEEVLSHPLWGISRGSWPVLRRVLAEAPRFLRLVYESNDWSRYDLVGFTSTFDQTMPSMCLARMIREHHPGVLLAAGGANFEATMGRGYMDLFPFLDYVCTGEGDTAFPNLMDNLRRGSPEVPPGILSRSRPAVGAGSPPPVTNLDALPVPDYDDYHRAASRMPALAGMAYLPLETSRGCWWGAKMHCTFCGLNGETMAFRRKHWRRVADEVAALEERYRPRVLQFTDNILGMGYFEDLLPHWAAAGGTTPKFFEIKANLSRPQVRLLRDSGILYVQPGIESFSDRTLKVMGKGVSAFQNVAVLRWCQELGIDSQWNLLFGFPGEDVAEYPAHAELLRRLVHLRPPEACAPIRLDRFSPNFTRYREQGFTSIRPMPSYRHVFPLDEDGLMEIAYFFEYTHLHRDRVRELGAPLVRLGRDWHRRWKRGENGTLAVRPHVL